MKSCVRRFAVWCLAQSLFLLPASGPALAASVPPGFSETVIAGPNGGNWNEAVGVTFDPVGRMFVWERGGRLWMRGPAETNFTQVLDISPEVGNWSDYGFVGFALDPNFLANGYIYLFYVVDRHYLLYYGTGSYDPNANEYNNATTGRLTRYTCQATNDFKSVDPASRLILLGDSKTNGVPILSNTHGVGSLVFGEDGTLLVSCGDGASANAVDTGGAVAASTAPQGLADGIIRAKENIGAYRAQLLDSLNGKILRIDPATGNGLPSNPFYDAANPKSARSRVWALGMRNPFRMTLRPESGSHDPAEGNPGVLYVGEVGWDNWEALKVITGPGQNMGWPLFEGLTLTPTFSAGGTYDVDVYNQDAPNPLYPGGGCNPYFSFRQLLKQATTNVANFPPFNNPCNASVKIPTNIPQFLHTRPALDWNHAVTTTRCPTYDASGNATTALVGALGAPVAGTQFKGNCSVGGTWYDGTAFPPQYRNTYFHADWGQFIVKNITTDGNDRPTSVTDFMSDAGAVVCMVQHPLDGSVYYVSYTWGDSGTVRQLTYTGNRTPIAAAAADVYYGPGPLTVQFSSAGSSDPDAQPVTFQWNFGDGSSVSTQANPSHLFTAPGSAPTNYAVTLTVTDSGGLSASKVLNIALNDTPPNVTITSPTNGTLYPTSVATNFTLIATVTDAESADSQLRYEWKTLLHHNNHSHILATDTNHTSSTATEPVGCDGENIYYFSVVLTVTDPRGLATAYESKLFPDCGSTDTPPTLSDIADQETTLGQPAGPVAFTISDAQVSAANLQLSAASSHPALVPVNNISFGGAGSNRTVTVTPAPNLNGTATITVTVNDGPNEVSDAFVLTVTGSNTPPVISGLGNQTAVEGTTTAALALTVGDAETPVTGLTLSGSATDPALVPPGNIVFGGSGANRTVTVTPAAGKTGTTTITVMASDGQLSASNSFNLLVTSLPTGTRTLTNFLAIFGSDSGAVAPYPSTINVSGLGGTVSNVTVTLRNAAHTWPDDWDILLVGPGGQQMVLVSDCGNGNAVTNLNLTFSAAAASFLPDASTLTSGTYKPTDFETGGVLPAPAPSGPYATNFAVFTGQQANGPWSLYVFDDGPGDYGFINGGWSLAVTTFSTNPPPPTITPIADQITLISTPTPALAFSLADANTAVSNLVLSAGSSNPALVPTNSIIFSGSGSNRTVTVTPVVGQTGGAVITVFASDGANLASQSFNLTVVPFLPATASFTNAAAITIRDTNSALPYPSSIAVNGLNGVISNVTVTLRGFTQTWGSDVDVLLVGPGGQKVMLMSDCGEGPANNVTLTLVDSAATALPGSDLATGTYRPTDLSDASPLGDNFPAPAPAGPFSATLSAFTNTAPNGSWSLYVLDDGPGDSGSIADGWALTISTVAGPPTNTVPTISAINHQTTIVNTATAAIPFTVSDAETVASNLVLTAFSSNTSLIATNRIVFGGSGANRTVTLTPASNQLGVASVALIVSDGSLSSSNSFDLTVTPAALTVTADSASRSYGLTNPVLMGSLTGLQAGDAITASFSSAATTNSPVGAYPISVTLSDPGGKLGNYVVTTNNGTLAVTNALLTLTANSTNKSYGSEIIFTGTEFSTASGTLLNGDMVTNATLASDGAGAGSEVGIYPVTITNALGVGLSNYLVSYSNGTMAVTAAALTVTASDTNKVYGATLAPVAFVVAGLLNADGVTNVSLVSLGGVSNAAVGTYAIAASAAQGVGLGNYNIGYSNGTLTVAHAVLTATADGKLRAYGQPNPEFTITFTGFVNGEDTNVLDALPLASSTATNTSAPGDYPIEVTGGGDDNYLLSPVGGILTITAPGPVTLTAVEFLDADTLRIAGTGDANVTYRIQASTDLSTWAEIGTAIADGGGAFDFEESGVASLAARYYRVAMP